MHNVRISTVASNMVELEPAAVNIDKCGDLATTRVAFVALM